MISLQGFENWWNGGINSPLPSKADKNREEWIDSRRGKIRLNEGNYSGRRGPFDSAVDERGAHKFTAARSSLGSVAKVYTAAAYNFDERVCKLQRANANVSQPRLFSPSTIYEMENFRHDSMGNHLPVIGRVPLLE